MIRHLRQMSFDDSIVALAVSKDGSLIAVACGSKVELIEFAAGDRIGRVAADAKVSGLAFSTDNKLLAVATSAPTVRVYDCDSGRIVQKLLRASVPDFLRTQTQIQVEFLGAGTDLITRADNSDVTIWNCETGVWEHLFRMPHRNAACTVSSDGKHFAMYGEPNANQYTGQVTMYRTNDGPEHRWHKHHKNDSRVTFADFSPDGLCLATGGAGDGIRVWNTDFGQPAGCVEERKGAAFSGALFVFDRHHLLSVRGKTLELLVLADERALPKASVEHVRDIVGYCGSDDGAAVVTYDNDNGVDFWHVYTTQ